MSAKRGQRALTKGGATMWQRLGYFAADRPTNSHRLEALAEWLEAGGEALSPERRGAGARFLRRLLTMPAVVEAIDARPKRGLRGSRKGEDVALYLHVCKLQEGVGSYQAALRRTAEAWSLSEKTVEGYQAEHGGLADERLADVRDSMFPAAMKAFGEDGFHDALLTDILDDHNSGPFEQWRIDFLREKHHEFQADGQGSQIAAMNRRAIAEELERIDKRAD